MSKSFNFWQVVGFAFTSVAGTLLHFLFDWSNRSLIAACFSAVNESIWEHMKLLFFPLLIFAIIEYFIVGKSHPQFWCVKLQGIIVGLTMIPTLYHTYTGITGQSVSLINIAIFYISVAAVFRLESMLIKCVCCRLSASAAVWLLLVIGGMYIFLTFSPPHLPLFQDPMTGEYGYADQSTDWSASILDIDGRIHKVDILLIQLFSQKLHRLTKTLEVDNLPFSQELDDIVNIRIVR